MAAHQPRAPRLGRDLLRGSGGEAMTDAGAGGPGPLSRILVELAASPGDGLLAAWQEELRPGDRLDRFEIRREVGRGGFGAVYEAWDGELGRAVAIKTLRPGRTRKELSAAWIHKEAEAVARLGHPGIVTIHDVCNCAAGPYLVMELLRGRTLAQRLAEGPLPAEEAERIAEEMARALAHAHGRGVLHRDLKPANVFLCEDGGVKLLDFGLAHLLGKPHQGGGGTPAYMAPEQSRGDAVDERADVFSAGKVLGEMLGQHPSRRLQEAVVTATAPDPAARPRDGKAWLDLLREGRRAAERSSRRRRLGTLAAAFLLLVATVAGVATWRERRSHDLADAAGRIPVVVADFENGTRDPDLDGLSGLLITSLEQSRKLRVMTRGRMLDLLPRAEKGRSRIDEVRAREAGLKGGAHAILVGSIRSFDDVYTVELRAIDPRREEYLFTLKEQATGKRRVPDLIDRLSSRTRDEFRESDPEVRATSVQISRVVTPSLEAYRHYFQGMDCLEQATYGAQECALRFERAVRVDPQFAMAWLQLAFARYWGMIPGSREAAREALRNVERAPPKEELQIRALAAQIEGREGDASMLFPQAAEAAPDDRSLQAQAADYFATRNELDRALPYLRRAVELDPGGRTTGRGYLASALGALGRTDELRALARETEMLPEGHQRSMALAEAYGWLGDRSSAIDALRRARATAGVEEHEADRWIDALRVILGDPAVEGELHARLPREPDLWFSMSMLQALRGQRRAALASLDRTPDEPLRHHFRAEFLVGDGDPEAVWREARMATVTAPAFAPNLAVHLAYLGALDHAAELARRLYPGSPRERVYRAVVLWKKGDRATALLALRALAAENPWSSDLPVLPPSFLLGELAVEMGEDETAVAALQRFQSLFVHNPYWGWAYPRSLVLLATAQERLGRQEEARATLAPLVARWKDADPGAPLLVEMRSLCRRISCRPAAARP